MMRLQEEFVQHSKSAERSSELLMLLTHVGWQMWSGVIIWLYQICQVATLLPPPQRVLYFTLTLQPQSKWIRTSPRGGLAALLLCDAALTS